MITLLIPPPPVFLPDAASDTGVAPRRNLPRETRPPIGDTESLTLLKDVITTGRHPPEVPPSAKAQNRHIDYYLHAILQGAGLAIFSVSGKAARYQPVLSLGFTTARKQ